MCKNCSWAWVAKIGERQTGACYFVSEVWVLKATLCATLVAQILITYPTKMGMVVTSFKVLHIGIVQVAIPKDKILLW